MDAPLPSLLVSLPPNPTSATVASAAVKAGAAVQPANTSPRAPLTNASGNAESLPPVPGAKLRLMCSYGGHIMPRPYDRSLTYVGGETRLLVVDRHAPLASLLSRLSRTLLNGRCFSLKYQLPNEDLDSLVSIATDEDLENMIEEYDRVTSSSTTATHRIRLFLFSNKLESAATLGSLLDGSKSDAWFADALNQSCLLPRGLSDTDVDNCLVNLDDVSGGDAEAQTLETNAHCENNKHGHSVANGVVLRHEMHLSAMPDSSMVEISSSSFGSSSSPSSMTNLPPIRVKLSEEQRKEEQSTQMSYSNVHIQRQKDVGLGSAAHRPPVIPPPAVTDVAAINNVVIDGAGAVNGSCMSGCQVTSDDDRGEPWLSAGYRKPPLPVHHVVVPPRAAWGYGLASPDSVASDSSISTATSFSRTMYYQDQGQALTRATGTQSEATSVPKSHYATLDQHQPLVQQPCMHEGVKYFPQTSSYISVYPHQQQNYPVYVMPVAQSQHYVSAGTPPLYPNSKLTTNPNPEAAQNVYRTAMTPNLQVLQLQPQPQCVGYPPVTHHAANANCGSYDFPNPPNEAVYYQTQPMASQFQSMTPAATVAALSDASKRMADDCTKQNIAVSESQPL